MMQRELEELVGRRKGEAKMVQCKNCGHECSTTWANLAAVCPNCKADLFPPKQPHLTMAGRDKAETDDPAIAGEVAGTRIDGAVHRSP